MLSFHNNPELKQAVLLQLEDQLIKVELAPLVINDQSIEIYAAPGRPPIDYKECSQLLGLPESLLRLLLLEADWCAYTDFKEAIRDTIKDVLKFFSAIKPGCDLSYVAPAYLEWLLKDPVFGATRYQEELADLLPASLASLESGIADNQLLQKIEQFQEMAEERYLSLYDDDDKSACRWSRAGQTAIFLANVQHFLADNTRISQEEIEHLLLMGVSHVDLHEPDYFKVVAKMNEKLFSLLK
jgi:hypothetical protein